MDVWGDDEELRAEGSWNGTIGRLRLDAERACASRWRRGPGATSAAAAGSRYFSAYFRRTATGELLADRGSPSDARTTRSRWARASASYLSREEMVALLMTVLSGASGSAASIPWPAAPARAVAGKLGRDAGRRASTTSSSRCRRGREEEARAFYPALLGIPEVEKPPDLAARGGAWFEAGALRLHLGVDPDFRPARKAHAALLVRDLPALLDRLRAAGVAVVDDDPMPGHQRVYVADPFGNRLELLEPEDPP